MQLLNASGTKIGLVWSSKQVFFIDRKRHCPLALFAPLFEIPGLSWLSLYKGDQIRDLEPYGNQVIDLGSHFSDFADTAWAIQQLDLVITVDTAVAHLAGALGKPVWILLPFLPDWRWMLERSDSPWYPTARLFRQAAPGEWDVPLAAVAVALEDGE
jgi:Glycosyltransferase family 9 (heptosyltransferase)